MRLPYENMRFFPFYQDGGFWSGSGFWYKVRSGFNIKIQNSFERKTFLSVFFYQEYHKESLIDISISMTFISDSGCFSKVGSGFRVFFHQRSNHRYIRNKIISEQGYCHSWYNVQNDYWIGLQMVYYILSKFSEKILFFLW